MKFYTNTKRAVRRWLLRTLQPCQEMVPLMSESLERRLGILERLKLILHLRVCAWCKRYLEQIEFIRQLVRKRASQLPRTNASDDLTKEARVRITKALAQTVEDPRLGDAMIED